MHSIRRALSLPLLVGVALLVGVSGLASSWLVAGQLRRDFDQALRDKARALATLAEQADGEVQMDFADALMPEFSVAPRREYFELWTADGVVVRRSQSLGEGSLPRSSASSGTPRLSDFQLPDGRPGRLVEISFEPLRDDEDRPRTGARVANRFAARGRGPARDPRPGARPGSVGAIGRRGLPDLPRRGSPPGRGDHGSRARRAGARIAPADRGGCGGGGDRHREPVAATDPEPGGRRADSNRRPAQRAAGGASRRRSPGSGASPPTWPMSCARRWRSSGAWPRWAGAGPTARKSQRLSSPTR